MADSELRCEGCQHVIGCCVETMHCGHYFCHECSKKMEELNVTCLLCECTEAQDIDILSCSEDLSDENDIPVKERDSLNCSPLTVDSSSSKEGSVSNCSCKTGMSVNSAGSKQQHSANESTNIQHVIDDDLQNDLDIMIDNALVIANEKSSQLNSALQLLEGVKAKNKVFEECVSRQIDEEFNRLFTALQARKLELLANVKEASAVFNTNLYKAASDIQAQKKDLEARARFARELNESPDLSKYCNLNQLIADLMVEFKSKHLIESLQAHSNIKFTINGERIIKLLETIGNLSHGAAANSKVMPNDSSLLPERKVNPLDAELVHEHGTIDATETACSIDFQSDLVDIVKHEYNMDLDYQPCLDLVDSGHQKLSMLSFKTECHSCMLPDVIIEEIIEDEEDATSDLQVPLSNKCDNKTAYSRKLPSTEVHSCKSKKFKKSQKIISSPPFFQKKSDQGNVDFVYLSHIINPCDFYVHRISQHKMRIMLERSLNTLYCKHGYCSPHDILELGEILAFNSSKRQLWCRGRITELIPLESKYVQNPCGPTRYRIEDILQITLFLLDYGNSEIFIVKSFAGACLKKGDPASIYHVDDLWPYFSKMNACEEQRLGLMDPLALHCSLDIVPQTPDGRWTKEVITQIFKMVNKKSVQMKILREENKTLIVDLKKPIACKTNGDMPVSLRDALVFLDLAKFPSQVPISDENADVAHYKAPEFPKNLTEAVVVVCHINDPSDFYVHVIGESEYTKVVNKIQDVYNGEEANDWKIACPVIGQACVAKYEDDYDDQWYRAEIIGLPSPQDVDLSYVDFGNVSRVNVTKLRRLKEEFLALPRKAICCRLAYIQPSHDTAQWSLEACKLFKELTSYKRLRCTSIGMFIENKFSVELFDDSPVSAMSINTVLVKHNVAAFIPCASGSPNPHLPLKEVWDTVLDRPLDSIEKCIDTISLSERKELDVYISHVVSPNKIFVQWLSTVNILKSLEGSMFKKYENSKPEIIEWQIDMYVAVHMSDDKIWRRGKIKSIISDELVEVFCYDFGMEELTNVTNLRTLDDNLQIYGAMCLECTLMDIQPAGGCKNWTATACDSLTYYLNGATAKMIIEENASVWPLPVRILCKNEAGQLIDMSDFLVNKGLALRDRRLKEQSSSMEVAATTNTSTSACEYVKRVDAESDGKRITAEENFTVSEESAMDVNIAEPYLPPLIPNETTFKAKVSHVGEDGTIYVIQECLDNDLGSLMLDIQNSYKCLGLMAPYNWKKGEGCLIKGSDTMSYRGRVLEILGGDMIKVQYVDFGYTEKIPKCHLYPSVFNQSVPRFCIPCHLIDVVPVGDHWQPDAILFLEELLSERVVEIHLVEPPKFCGDSASIYLYCGNALVSVILEQYAYCIPKDCERKTKNGSQHFSKISHEKIWGVDFQELLHSGWNISKLCKYLPSPLPSSTEVFEVKVTHIETPDRMFICIEDGGEISQNSNDHEDGSDAFASKLKEVNNKSNILPCLTDFKTEMPCLAIYNDDMLLHRAKIVSVKKYDPIAFIVEFVDYGSTGVIEACSLFQLPPCLIHYPAKAIKVKLAGFMPRIEDEEEQRLPYKPEWSFKAMIEIIELVHKKTLFAKCLPSAPENTVYLFDENLQPVHSRLLSLGLADPE